MLYEKKIQYQREEVPQNIQHRGDDTATKHTAAKGSINQISLQYDM
jgi:hypothetical protein